MKKLICAILALMLLVSSVITVSAAESTATITTKNSNVGYSASRIGDDTVYNTIAENVLYADGTIKNDSYTSDANGGIVNMKALNSGTDIDNFAINADALDNKYFYITDAEGMIVFSKVVALGDSVKVSENEYCFKDKVVYLVADIDFAGSSDKMKPIGENGEHYGFVNNGAKYETTDYGTQPHDIKSAREFFSGKFDGRGHKIIDLDMAAPYLDTYKSGNPVALFKVLRGDATIQNLVIDNTCSFINKASASTASGVKTAGNGQGNATASLAAFVFADNDAKYGDSKSINITNVASYATVNGGTSTNNNNSTYRNDVAGGLVAFLNSNISATYGANIQYCTFSGEITSAGSTAGGIVGVVHTGKVYAIVVYII